MGGKAGENNPGAGGNNRNKRGTSPDEKGLQARMTAGAPAPVSRVSTSLPLCVRCPTQIAQV
jgi:hypothetical protein